MSTTPNTYAINAATLGGFSELQLLQAIVYLLAQLNGASMTPNQIAKNAVCYCGDNRSLLQQAVYLLGQILVNGGTGGGAVTELIAGSNITLSPPSGVGAVTISSTGGSSNANPPVPYTVYPPANPANTALPAIAYDPTGNLVFLGWNVGSQSWN